MGKTFGRDMDAWHATGPKRMDFAEKTNSGKLPSLAEVKLMSIAGAGFFMDAYDLFIINMVVPILILVYFPKSAGFDGKHIPYGLQGGVLKASANIGNVIGQVAFGFLGDSFGRQFVYGKELIIIIVSIIVMICVPDSLSGKDIITWLTVTRIFMGIGIGGDYPMSATIVSDRAHLRRRGVLLAVLFSGQGWGAFIGAAVAVAVVAGYRHKVHDLGDFHDLTGAWRILIGLGLVPAVCVLFVRLTMAESIKFVEARRLQDNPFLIHRLREVLPIGAPVNNPSSRVQRVHPEPVAMQTRSVEGDLGRAGVKFNSNPGDESNYYQSDAGAESTSGVRAVAEGLSNGHAVAQDANINGHALVKADSNEVAVADASRRTTADSQASSHDEDITRTSLGFKPVGKRAHNKEFFKYFSEWRHLKVLIGTSMTWFLVDVAFYGINLNQSFILTALKFTSSDPYEKLMKTAVGNLIIIAAGYLPGYYFSAMFIERIGRRKLQNLGFVMSALFLGIAGGAFHTLIQEPAPFFIVFALMQFFFNFGANTTTFIIPAEVFPSRVRASAHGVSAAIGKLGAILASLAFVDIAEKIGTSKVLLIFMAVSLLGIPFTFLIPETTDMDADIIDRLELLEKAQMEEKRARRTQRNLRT